jgi:hypothetical protein
MKGPYERLKYDLRRVWECSECHHRERAEGAVTFCYCGCQRKKKLRDRVAMTLVDDRTLHVNASDHQGPALSHDT